jgi:phenylalanyl-tRNA synthetase beta chain
MFSELTDAGIHYAEPSKFPNMEIDLSFVSETFAPIGKAIENANCPLIKKVEVTDTYRDENGKSITTRITFSHPEKTLTRDEVMDVANSIIDALAKDGIALKS